MNQYSKLPYRQIHLDFHTSEYLKNVGSEFNKQEFQEALQLGHVNSVTSFATCHHGWCYYESDVWDMHPEMKEPLLPKMLEAAKEIDVQTPIYLTVGWNERIGRLHPEWVVKDREGNPQDLRRSEEGRRMGWHRICLNTPYLDELLLITREVMEKFNPVGIFFDIIWEKPCYCSSCLESMAERKIDLEDEAAILKFAKEVYLNYHKKITEVIKSINPKTRIYHNGSDKKGRTDLAPYYSHYEIESLPTTDWCGGYEHFVQNARYFKHKGLDYLGMTGKFHQSWGEFGGYKNADALRYETMRMIMLGGKCSIGDQMLPEGVLDKETYRLIGEAYKEVEEKEAWCSDVKNIAEIAVLCPSAIANDTELEEAEVGACMMLSECHYLFDMIDEHSDLAPYKVLILPDDVVVSKFLQQKIENYLKQGGQLIASAESGLNPETRQFVLDYGVDYISESEWYIDFTKVSESISKNMVTSPYFNYMPGPKLELRSATVLANAIAPHFNRTFDQFCSHGNTPSGPDASYPSVVLNENIIYIGPKVFTMYREKGMKLHRDLVKNCIDLFIPKTMLQCELPSGAIVVLNEKDNDSKVLHVLYATPIPRGDVAVIEDIITLYNVKISLQLPSVSSVKLVPSGEELEYQYDNGICTFIFPEIKLHQMIEIQV